MKERFDVAIVGGGLAGMVAAAELLDAGRRVVVLDRDTEANFGGLARESFGGMFFVDSPQQRRAGIRDRKLVSFLKTVLLGNRSLVDELCEICPDFVTAGSLEELADRMNALTGTTDVDASVLRDEVEAYDDGIRRGPKYFNDDQLRRIAQLRRYRGDRVRTCKFQPIDDRKAKPLIAIREFILSRKSLGGIRTDLSSRVLDGSDRPIDGLYAVGEASGFGGGGSHGLRALEGTFLGCCVLTARRAAGDIIG